MPIRRAACTYSLFSPPASAAHGARILHPEGQTDGEHHHPELTTSRLRCSPNSAARRPSISMAIRIAGKVLLHVGDAHDDRVDACRPRNRPISPSDMPSAPASSTAHHADRHRRARAVEDGGEHVAALIVGAEQEARVAALLPGRRIVRVEQARAPSDRRGRAARSAAPGAPRARSPGSAARPRRELGAQEACNRSLSLSTTAAEPRRPRAVARPQWRR